jgi:BirA family biotin operon repressor/biotin-[acetyl-CoA-carboxylase] ligase
MTFHIHYLDSVDSTNDRLKEKAQKGAPEGTVIWATEQTKGRGQRQRKWVSLKNKGLYMSICIRPINPVSPFMYTLFPAVAVAEWLAEQYNLAAGVKWPNDVLVDEKKICGVLTEGRTSGSRIEYLVIGLGINVNHSRNDLYDLTGATSMTLATGRSFALESLLSDFEPYFQRYYRARALTISPAELIQRWMNRCVHIQEWVTIHNHSDSWQGKFMGLDDSGQARLKTENGQLYTLTLGSLSLRRTHDSGH